MANTAGESSPELDGRVQAEPVGGAVYAGEAAGLSGDTGGKGRGSAQSAVGGRENQADGRGRSYRDPAGTTQGDNPEMAERNETTDSSDRTELEDLASGVSAPRQQGRFQISQPDRGKSTPYYCI